MRTFALVLVASLVTIGCGGGENSLPTSPTPQPYNQTLTGTVSTFGVTFHALNIPRSGNMTLRLSWQGNPDLDLYLSSSTCPALYPTSACGILAGSDGLANPETITRTVAQGENFRIWVDNLSTAQSVNYTLTISIQ